MSERGQVIEVAGETAQVRISRTDACSGCKRCAAGTTKEYMIATVQNQCRAKEGDWVFIEVEQKTFVVAALIMYGAPLLAFFAGVFAGWLISGTVSDQSHRELISFSTGIVFIAATYAIIRLNEKRFRSKEMIPTAFQIAEDSEQIEEK